MDPSSRMVIQTKIANICNTFGTLLSTREFHNCWYMGTGTKATGAWNEKSNQTEEGASFSGPGSPRQSCIVEHHKEGGRTS